MIVRLMLLVVCFVAFLFPQINSRSSQFGNVDDLTQNQLKEYLSFIASDELQGRDTPSYGLNVAAQFIATHLSQWGYLPTGDSGSYFQKIALMRTRVSASETYVEMNGVKTQFGDAFLTNTVHTNVSGGLVFVRHGFVSKEKNIDSYEGVDVHGKIMIVLSGLPSGMRFGDLRGKKKGKDYENSISYAQKNGAAGIITIPTQEAIQRWGKSMKTVTEIGENSVIAFQNHTERTIPVLIASPAFLSQLFSGEKYSPSPLIDKDSLEKIPTFDLSPHKRVTLNIKTVEDTLFTQNICATLKGSDPSLQKEFVAFGAHYDHVGMGEPIHGDSIYNGADDDGSGTAALLAMAETFAKGPKPKRSLLFVWHCGEEKGLWGSKYFTEYPTLPLNQIVVQLNIDMIGRSKPDTGMASTNDIFSGRNETFVIGSKMMSSQLWGLSEDVNASLLNLKFNYKFDDPKDPLRLFYRSDHYNYAKHGIPIIFYFDGIHEDYHQVTDEVAKIDFEKYLRVTKTVFATGWTIANLKSRPLIDQPLSHVFEE